jgi:hypothetical protein
MKFSNFLLFTLISFAIGSCLVLPKTENVPDEKCKLVTKSWTLEVHELGKQSKCDANCGDIIKGVVECSKGEDCIKMIAVVSVGWTVVAASVVGVGNTVHWIEKQGRCEESTVRSSINRLYEKTVDVGGFVLETGSDFVDLFKQNK